MRKIILFALFLFFFTSHRTNAQQDWNWKSPNPQGNTISKIFIANNSLWGLGERSTIISTSNMGASWKVVNNFMISSETLTSFQKYSESTYYVGNNMSRIYRTTNAGLNWVMLTTVTVPQNVSFINFTSSTIGYLTAAAKIYKTTNGGEDGWVVSKTFADQISSINFVNDNTGFLTTVGSMEGGVSKVFKTTNGGTSWDSTLLGSWSNPLKIIKFTNANTGFMHYQGNLYKTTNQGVSWNVINNEYYSLIFILSENEWVGVYDNEFKLTTNGGASYTRKALTPLTRQDIYFESLQKGYILGINNRISVTENAGDTWTQITEANGNGSASDRLLQMKFVNENTGYIAGWNGYFKKTTDQGETWISHSTGMNGHITGVDFTDVNTGYIIGGNSGETFIRKTTDGGNNFFPLFQYDTYIDANIKFVNANTGFAAGYYKFYRTSDAGESWSPVPMADNVDINAIEFINENTGLITGKLYLSAVNKIYRTVDAGLTWNEVYSTNLSLYKIQMLSAQRGYICGNTGLHTTYDGGITWIPLYGFGMSTYFSSMYFINSTTGFAGTDFGRICKTSNNGMSWGYGSTPTSQRVEDIKFFNANNGIVIGGNGTILKTYNGGGIFLISISSANNTVVSEYKLHQNYPNPFNPVTNIQFDIPKDNFVTVKVYDMLGKEIENLVSGFKQAGSYMISFDASSLGSGIYFYKLDTENFSETKRMVLVK